MASKPLCLVSFTGPNGKDVAPWRAPRLLLVDSIPVFLLAVDASAMQSHDRRPMWRRGHDRAGSRRTLRASARAHLHWTRKRRCRCVSRSRAEGGRDTPSRPLAAAPSPPLSPATAPGGLRPRTAPVLPPCSPAASPFAPPSPQRPSTLSLHRLGPQTQRFRQRKCRAQAGRVRAKLGDDRLPLKLKAPASRNPTRLTITGHTDSVPASPRTRTIACRRAAAPEGG